MMTMRRDTVAVTAGLLAGASMMALAVRRMRGLRLEGRSVLITGGSRGLGLLIARECGRQGARVTLAARDRDELERARQTLDAEGIRTAVLVADVGQVHEAQWLVRQVIDAEGRLDVLVNNAGVIQVGPVSHMTVADFEDAMAIHFWGPLHTMRAAIPHMRDAGGGRIVNISSIGGMIGVPHLVPYCASKFALTGVSTAMRAELAKDRILITTVCPGLMRTGSPFNAWFKGHHREEFAWFAIADSLPLLSVDGRRAAAQVVDAFRHGDAQLVIGWPARLGVALNVLAPAASAFVMEAAARLLPGDDAPDGDTARSGWQSGSRWAPSRLTRASEVAAAANNELPPA